MDSHRREMVSWKVEIGMIGMNRFGRLGLVVMALAAGAAQAQDGWWLRAGPANVSFSESAEIAIGGSRVPGATATVKNNTTFGVEVGYRFSPSWSAGLTIGLPPTTEVNGAGAAQAFGKLGKAKYAPAVLAGQWSFLKEGPWTGYVGAGVTRLMVTSTEDGALQNLKIKDKWGAALQAGVEYQLGAQWGLFLDLKKFKLSTEATGNLAALGGAPGTAKLRLDPLVTHAGVTWRF